MDDPVLYDAPRSAPRSGRCVLEPRTLVVLTRFHPRFCSSAVASVLMQIDLENALEETRLREQERLVDQRLKANEKAKLDRQRVADAAAGDQKDALIRRMQKQLAALSKR